MDLRRGRRIEVGVGFQVAVASLVALGVLVILDSGMQLWSIWLSISAFMFSASLRRLRPAARRMLTPRGFMFWSGFIGLVVMPAFVTIAGEQTGQLPRLPSWSAINWSLIWLTVFFLVMCLSSLLVRDAQRICSTEEVRESDVPSFIYILFLLVFGAVGAVSRVLMQGGFATYFSGGGVLLADANPLLIGLAGFAPPLMTAGALLLWQRLEVHGRSTRLTRACVILLALLPMTTYSYNRGAVVYTALCLVAVLASLRASRPIRVAFGVTVVAVAALLFGFFRASVINGVEYSDGFDVFAVIQTYGNAPQFGAFAVESSQSRFPGGTPIASALAPLPLLGTDYRAVSGTRLYNTFIYPQGQASDQILRFDVEVLLSWGLPGLIAMAMVIGLCVGKLEQLFQESRTVYRRYYAAFAGFVLTATMWLSVQVVSQLIIYFVIPGVVAISLMRGTGLVSKAVTSNGGRVKRVRN